MKKLIWWLVYLVVTPLVFLVVFPYKVVKDPRWLAQPKQN